MHRGTWRMGALALALALGATALGRAGEDDDPPAGDAPRGNWFTRLFRPSARKKVEPKANEVKDPAPPPSPAVMRQRAYMEWLRRQEVCDKLREIALETGDEELRRKADSLNQRIWDSYLQRTGGAASAAPLARSGVSADERYLERKLALPAAPRKTTEGRAEVRED